MKQIKESAASISGINIAPIINVALVLVLVMLITAPILNIPNLPVKLPEAVTEETKEQNITVSLTEDGQLSVNAEIVTMRKVPGRIRALLRRDKRQLVIVRADKNCWYGDVESLIELIKKQSGARRVAVATIQVAAPVRE